MSQQLSHDEPPMSRLFVICNKSNSEEELREAFQKYGNLDDIFLVKDHKSGENKGLSNNIFYSETCRLIILHFRNRLYQIHKNIGRRASP